MSLPRPLARFPHRALALGAAAIACTASGAVLPSAAAAASTSVSANWAGYVALPSSAGKSFSSVSGSWTQPSVSCTAGDEGYSAVWVGLGGYHENASALEQIGTEADCSRTGQPNYTTWYELIPAGPVTLKLHATPGDQMTASVTARGHEVTLRLRDLTTGARYSLTRRLDTIDTSSAEWIVEAPSTCFSDDNCRTLPLSDFGTLAFTSATATVGAHTGPVTDPDWNELGLELREGPTAAGFAGWRDAHARADVSLVAATPSALTGDMGAFSVRWQEQPLQSEQPEGRPFGGIQSFAAREPL